jgi:hypothetical protein
VTLNLRDLAAVAEHGSAQRTQVGMNWHVDVMVEKFSAEQAAYATQKMLTTYTLRQVLRMRGLRRELHGRGMLAKWKWEANGAMLRRWCGAPELGVAHCCGNQLVNVGLTKVATLLTGGTSGSALTGPTGSPANRGYVAIGSSTAAFPGVTATNVQTAVYYNLIDSGWPTVSGTSPFGVITVQSTFGTSVANAAWNEWGWGTSTATVTAGATQPTTGSADSLINLKSLGASGLGTKASGASWVFTSTLTFS